MVIEQKRNDKLSEARQVFAKARNADNLGKWASKENAGTDEAKAIMLILNDYEFIASAMRDEAFNLSLYKRMKFSTVVRDWESLQAFVHEKRQEVKHPTLFQEFEWMAKKFKKKPLKQDND